MNSFINKNINKKREENMEKKEMSVILGESAQEPIPTSYRPEPHIVDFARSIYSEAADILVNKNHDYATDEDPLTNLKAGAEFLGVRTSLFILAIITSKTARLKTINLKGGYKVVDEKPKDTVRDNINYFALYEKALEEEAG